MVALMSSGVTDSSLKYHLENAKNYGVTRKEIAAVITHVAFYAGWPKGWAVFHMAKEVWTDELSAKGTSAEDARRTDFNLCSRTGILSGMGQGCNSHEAG